MAQSSGNAASAFVGTWHLVSTESLTSGGRVVYPLGQRPHGHLVYEAGGRMAVQLMNPDRPGLPAGDPEFASEAQLRAVLMGYRSYYGTYTVHADQGIVVHHVEGALIPDWVGGNQIRHYRFEGNRLILRTSSMLVGGQATQTTLVWERVS